LWFAALLALLGASCAAMSKPHTMPDQSGRVDIAQLWVDPADLEMRDFRAGAGGVALAPDPSAHYEVTGTDSKGYSRGYAVRDAHGVEWSVKTGPEAQPEVVVSRVLWGIGYHQPPTYLLSDFTLEGKDVAPVTGPARFRRHVDQQTVIAEWSWYENPFVNTQPFRGLLVANVMLNNWDWKTSNNKIYDAPAAPKGPRRMYVVRDLGASLGKTSFPSLLKWAPTNLIAQGSRNDVEDFESQGFIKSVDGERVKFDYRGINPNLVETLTPADVVWTCRLMARISDTQWQDAFAAGGYPSETQQRYIAKLKAKIAEGLRLVQQL